MIKGSSITQKLTSYKKANTDKLIVTDRTRHQSKASEDDRDGQRRDVVTNDPASWIKLHNKDHQIVTAT